MGKTIIGIITILLISLEFTGPSYSQKSQPEFNVVNLEIVRGTTILGRPTLVMEMGSTAVSTFAGKEGYSVKVNLNKDSADSARLRKLDIELYTNRNDKWVLAGHPIISTMLNSQSGITISTDSANETIKINFSVVDSYMPTSASKFGKNKCTEAKILRWRESLSKPVSWFKKIASQSVDIPCCTLCTNYTCCSSGPMCCSDQYRCPGRRCCNSTT